MYRKKIGTRRGGHPDYFIIAGIAMLTIFGLLMIASTSSHLGKARFDDAFYYLKHQIFYGLSLGIFGFIVGSKLYYRFYEGAALWMLLGCAILLALVFTNFGVTTKGATRWLSLGPVSFQPSELAKLTFVIYLAAWLSRRVERKKEFLAGFLPFLLITAAFGGLLLKQPATSTTMILIATAIVVYFVSGARLSYIFSFAFFGMAVLLFLIYFTPYRLERFMIFLDPGRDAQSGGFHINQALIAIGSGEIDGLGYGQSTTKLSYLPEPIGDSIFAVIGEEFGFIGTSALVAVYFALILKIFLMARRFPETFGQLLLVGFGTLIALQAFVHIGAISGLIPLTGTPLPFISYGGTSLAVFLTMGGIIVNISKYS